MRTSCVLSAFVATLLMGSAAQAGLIGDKVDGSLTFGQLLSDDAAYWNSSPATIGPGSEFAASDGIDRVHANFSNSHLIIHDREKRTETSNGWEMTFKLISPDEFKHVRLEKSNFDGKLTYSVHNDIMTIAWAGDRDVSSMTSEERKKYERFKAIFHVSSDAVQPVAVPEPGSLALLAAGLFATIALGRRKKVATATA